MVRSILPLFTVAVLAAAPALASEPVPVPHFDSVELSGGGDVTIVRGPVERVTIVQGSTQFTRVYVERDHSLKIDACNERCPHLYNLHIEIQSPHVRTLAVDGGGAISIAPGFGQERKLTAAVSGGGRIDTRAVSAADVAAAVTGGGQLFVRAANSLTGVVSGGGSVRYWGNPKVTSVIDGGGSIRAGY